MEINKSNDSELSQLIKELKKKFEESEKNLSLHNIKEIIKKNKNNVYNQAYNLQNSDHFPNIDSNLNKKIDIFNN